jgi:adenosine deaminase
VDAAAAIYSASEMEADELADFAAAVAKAARATSLPAEYKLASAAFGWSDEIVRDVARTSIDASFANAEVKAHLKSALVGWAIVVLAHNSHLKSPVIVHGRSASWHPTAMNRYIEAGRPNSKIVAVLKSAN